MVPKLIKCLATPTHTKNVAFKTLLIHEVHPARYYF